MKQNNNYLKQMCNQTTITYFLNCFFLTITTYNLVLLMHVKGITFNCAAGEHYMAFSLK